MKEGPKRKVVGRIERQMNSKRNPTIYLDAEQNDEGRWVAFGFCETNDSGLKYFGVAGTKLFAGTKEEVLSFCISYEDRHEALIDAETGWFVRWLNERAEALRSFQNP